MRIASKNIVACRTRPFEMLRAGARSEADANGLLTPIVKHLEGQPTESLSGLRHLGRACRVSCSFGAAACEVLGEVCVGC